MRSIAALTLALLLGLAAPARAAEPTGPDPLLAGALSGALPIALTVAGFSTGNLVLNLLAPATTGLGHHLVGHPQRGMGFAAGGYGLALATGATVYQLKVAERAGGRGNMTGEVLTSMAAAGLAGALVAGWAAWDAHMLAERGHGVTAAPRQAGRAGGPVEGALGGGGPRERPGPPPN